MPIKPENKKRYPPNWKEIRARILERAGHRCERCTVDNYAIVVRGAGEDEGTYMLEDGRVFSDYNGEPLGRWRMTDYHTFGKAIKIVLTIAHLDHVPENCNDENLLALCQKCHLGHDREYHKTVRARTAKAKKAIEDFFG